MWIDNHTHLNMLEEPIEEALQKAKQQNITKCINIATCPDDLTTVFETAQKYYPMVYCTQGIHPHDAKLYNQEAENLILSRLKEKEVVALGEMGLDFYYNHSDHDTQCKVFQRQMEIAAEHSMPIQIHTRDAEKETIEMLQKFDGKITGVLHCFSGSKWLAEEGLKLGLNLSFSGILTFKKATEIQEVAKEVPLDRIHFETDAPFLAPTPLRGKKNTPAYMIHTAEFFAQLRSVDLATLSAQVLENTQKTFPKIQINAK